LPLKLRSNVGCRLSVREQGAPSMRISTILACTTAYRTAYKQGHHEKSQTRVAERLASVKKALGKVLLPDLTQDRIRKYMAMRQSEGAGGRAINMEVGLLARAIGRTWSVLWPKVKRNEEPKDTGRALSNEEEARLLTAAAEA
jgi:hypothetical protein